MAKILLNGYLGRMGHVVAGLVEDRDDMEIAAGVDVNASDLFPFPTYTSFADVKEEADVIIDFSNPASLPAILEYAKAHKVPAILCTTGYSDDDLAAILEASKVVPMFRSANMSIGVNLITELAKKAAEVLYPGFDIEIVEAHHNKKLDAPSGTAIMIGDEIKSVIDEQMDYEFDRHSKREQRPANEIGMSSIRGGTIVGEHDIIFAGPDEVIKISHTAYSRTIFANGALNAAKWLTEEPRQPGLYSMKDVLA